MGTQCSTDDLASILETYRGWTRQDIVLSQDGGTKETQANATRELNMVISLFHVALTKY